MAILEDLHRELLGSLGKTVLGTRVADKSGSVVPSFADSANRFSVALGEQLLERLRADGVQHTTTASISQNAIGSAVGPAVEAFLRSALLGPMQRIRPVAWQFQREGTIATTAQYRHLAILERLHNNPDRLVVSPQEDKPARQDEAEEERTETLVALSGQYVVKPDLLVLRPPLADNELNVDGELSAFDPTATTGELADLRRLVGTGAARRAWPLMHANVSLKWTLRSDRAQNVRTEALQMIRQRRGPMPHMVAVTAEPLPSRLESLARGTGEIDAVYHVALHPLIAGLESLAGAGETFEKQARKALPVIYALRDAGRLKDITDLPFDLAS